MNVRSCDLPSNKPEILISQVKMPCHNASVVEVQQEQQACKCLDCHCPDVCSLVLSYSIDTANSIQFYDFSKHMTRFFIGSSIPVKPLVPLLRPPIFS